MITKRTTRLFRRQFWVGVFIGVLSPALALFFMVALWQFMTGGSGGLAPPPQCYVMGRKQVLSPNGQFIATSVIIDCEGDKNRAFWNNNYVFVTAARLARTGHVYSLERKSTLPADIAWRDNRSIFLQAEDRDIERIAIRWCGISATSDAKPSP